MPRVFNNVIEANSASYDETTLSLGGGGIFASATDLDERPTPFAVSAPLIVNNIIAANGGGIAVVDSLLGAATIANIGAGIYWANTWPTNANNIVVFNTQGFERGIAGTSDAEILFNDVYGNTVLGNTTDYCNTNNRTGASGNISIEPAFANFAIGDFHVQPTSPCIDAGDVAWSLAGWLDFDGQARVQGATVDVGADESEGMAWDIPTPVVRVGASGDDTDGTTWAKALHSVGNALAMILESGGEVWVKEGIYVEHLYPPAFTYLYGGFAGHETSRDQHDPASHPTILDGDETAPVVYFRNTGLPPERA